MSLELQEKKKGWIQTRRRGRIGREQERKKRGGWVDTVALKREDIKGSSN